MALFHIISQKCSLCDSLSKLLKWFRSAEQIIGLIGPGTLRNFVKSPAPHAISKPEKKLEKLLINNWVHFKQTLLDCALDDQ